MIVRVLALAVCAAAIAFGATRLGSSHACRDARNDVFRVGSGQIPAARSGEAAVELIDRCDGGAPLAAGSSALLRIGNVDMAMQLADEAIRRDPRDYRGWVARAFVEQRVKDDDAMRRDALRALALNPRHALVRQLAGV